LFVDSVAEDNELIKQVLEGKTDSFAALVNKYQLRVRGFCRHMLLNFDDADDAAQEVFIKVYKALSSFKEQSSFSTWLYRIGANHCTDILRKRVVRKEQSWDFMVERDGENIEALYSVSADVAIPVEHRELVNKLLAALPVDQREVFILREIEGLSYQEISLSLECSVDSVKGRLKRAREKLSEILKKLERPKSLVNKESQL
jgi:RNA polymerase sigma-70 factor (ECF subfamily)